MYNYPLTQLPALELQINHYDNKSHAILSLLWDDPTAYMHKLNTSFAAVLSAVVCLHMIALEKNLQFTTNRKFVMCSN